MRAAVAQAVITIDSIASAEGGIGGGTNNDATYNHTIAADANLIIVCVAERNTLVTGFIDEATVTVGGASATKISSSESADGGIRAVLFAKIAPSTGIQSIVTVGDSGTDRMIVGSISFKGIDASSAFNTASTNASNGSLNADVDTLASASGEVGVLCGSVATLAAAPSPDATSPVSVERIDLSHSDSTSMHGFIYTEDGASPSINMRVDLASSARWAASAVSVRALASAGVFGPPRRRGM